MLQRRLISLTRNDIDILTNNWVNTILSSPYTTSYRKLYKEILILSGRKIYEELEAWLSPDHPEEEVKAYYKNLGKTRFEQNFKLEEVIMGILLCKRTLWEHVLSKGLPSTAFELYAAIDLNNYVIQYFDRAIYFTVCGYREAERYAV